MNNGATTLKKLSLSLLACLTLAACSTTGPSDTTNINDAIARAKENVAKRSGQSGSLSYHESKYKRNSDDPVIAANYARSLREHDYLSRAEIVLAPFATDKDSVAAIKSEYAAIQLAQGKYKAAEKYARQAVEQDPADYQAYHRLGIALDAQAKHEEAEKAFRTGLDHWQGDPTAIMNNLALNLTSQSFLDEAVKILLQAQEISPGKIEIERNLRIVRALQQSTGPKAPKPKTKPDAPESELNN